MKNIRFKNIVLSILFILLSVTLLLSFVGENILSKTFSEFYIKQRVIGNIINLINEETPLSSNKIDILQKEFDGSKDMDQISKKYFDAIIKYYVDNEYTKVEINDEINNILDSCDKEYNIFECVLIKNKIQNTSFNHIYTYTLLSIDGKINSKVVFLIKVYKVVTSVYFRLLILLVMLLVVINIYKVNREKYKYLLMYSYNLYLSAIIGCICTFITASYLTKLISANFETKFSLNLSCIYYIEAFILIVALVLHYAYFRLNKRKKQVFKNNKK
jgi:hypothetical protein